MITLTLFSISFASAFTFDNVKSYDVTKKEVIIKNSFGLGEDVAKIRWLTPIDYHVSRGNNYVAKYNYTYYLDNNGGLDLMDFYDKRKDMLEINRNFEYKVLTYKEVDKNITSCFDKLLKNGSISNICKVTGTYKSKKPVRTNLDYSKLEKGKTYTIEIWTDVQKGDIIELIPTYHGERLEEFSTWTEDLNVGLKLYWKLEESSGAIIDASKQYNGTNSGGDTEQTGHINYGYYFDRDEDDKATSDIGTSISAPDKYTISMWAKYNDDYASGPENYGLFGFGQQPKVWYRALSETWAIDTGATSDYSGADSPDGVWRFVIVRFDGTDVIFSVYDSSFNFVTGANYTESGSAYDSSIFQIGSYGDTTRDGSFTIDEVAVWNRSLSDSEVVEVLESTTGYSGSVGDSINPIVTLNSPENVANLTSKSVVFNCTASDDVNLDNVTLYIDGVSNETNTTGLNNTAYIFSKTVSEGDHNWTCEASDNSSNTNTLVWRTFNITLPVDSYPTIVQNSPENYANFTTNNVDLNCTGTDNLVLSKIGFYVNGVSVYNTTDVANNTAELYDTPTYSDGAYNWSCFAEDNASQITNSGTRYFTVDTTSPAVIIIHPVNNTIYHDGYITSNSKTIDLNWTTTDDHLDTCWYYNTTANVTLTCGNNATVTLPYGVHTFNFYANDTFGLEGINTTTASWWYDILQTNTSYESSALSGTTKTFNLSVNYNSTEFPNSAGYLIWNGTSYNANRTGSSGTYNFTKTLSIPSVSEATNITFYWSIDLNNGTSVVRNSSSYSQLVTSLGIGNCSIYDLTLYNFTVVDEKTQTQLDADATNLSTKANIQIWDEDRTAIIYNHSTSWTEENPFAICLNDNLTSSNYKVDFEMSYDADGYAHEFYNIQNTNLSHEDLNTNITLYSLDDDDSQEFKISYKDENLLPVGDVLIQIQRRYIDEGVFKTIEIPKTDSQGETIGHLELSDVIYTFIITKNGVVQATFNNQIAYCDNIATGDCTIDLNTFASTIEVEDFEVADDISYTFDWDRDTKDITVVYTIPSGTASTVKLNATLFDQLGNTTACSDSLTSASGTLTCNVPASFGNTSVLAKLTKGNELVGQALVTINEKPSDLYGNSIMFIGFLLMITVVGVGISSSPMVMGFFLLIGAVASLGLNMVDRTGFIGAGATILWLIVALIMIIYKGSNRQ